MSDSTDLWSPQCARIPDSSESTLKAPTARFENFKRRYQGYLIDFMIFKLWKLMPVAGIAAHIAQFERSMFTTATLRNCKEEE